ncbi:hyalin-like, partial [Anneissia japonica]|uniref:hyalin-like n=1 Tax=Anneissia japonica TaxID=1529436 RepID=UPI0014257523
MDNVQVAMFSTNSTDINPATMTIDAAYAVVETTGVLPIGQTVIEYIFADNATPTSNEATCYITIQIEDNESPVINCPKNVTSNNYIAEYFGVINVNTDEGSPNAT